MRTRLARRPWRALVVIAAASLIATGCAVWDGARLGFNYVGVGLGNVKFPLTVRTNSRWPLNRPLVVRDFLRMEDMDPDRRIGATCKPEPRRRGLAGKALGFAPWADCIDALEEFRHDEGKDSLVVVAISGGGIRAARLAAHALALLERRYRDLAPRPSTATLVWPMIDLVDAFSTVSGGSLYTYHVARGLEVPDPESKREQEEAKRQDAFQRRLAEDRSGRTVSMEGPPVDAAVEVDRAAFFHKIVSDDATTRGTLGLGSRAAQHPFGLLGLAFLRSFFSDWNYSDQLAKGLEMSRNWDLFNFLWPARLGGELYFGRLPPRPRFYFNATALELGLPLVLTQRLTNLPPRADSSLSSRLDLVSSITRDGISGCPDCERTRPLRHAVTLEELGSSPGSFRAAYAAVASAAFPFGVEPLLVRKYQLSRNRGKFDDTEDPISLADGGVYDNSGMSTAVDLFEYLVHYRHVKHLVLIVINADATRYDYNLPKHAATVGGSALAGLNSPLPSLFSASRSLNLIHFINKRRGEEIAWERLVALEQRIKGDRVVETAAVPARLQRVVPENVQARVRAARQLNEAEKRELKTQVAAALLGSPSDEREFEFVHYFPMNLSQLSADDAHAIHDGDTHYALVRDAPTGYWLRSGDDEALEAAAAAILSTEQRPGWRVGPECRTGEGRAEVRRLDDAAAFALARAASSQWASTLVADDWCARNGP